MTNQTQQGQQVTCCDRRGTRCATPAALRAGVGRGVNAPVLPVGFPAVVERVTGHPWGELVSKKRTAEFVGIRAAMAYWLRFEVSPQWTFEAIADVLHRDHTTIIHSTERISEFVQAEHAGKGRSKAYHKTLIGLARYYPGEDA